MLRFIWECSREQYQSEHDEAGLGQDEMNSGAILAEALADPGEIDTRDRRVEP